MTNLITSILYKRAEGIPPPPEGMLGHRLLPRVTVGRVTNRTPSHPTALLSIADSRPYLIYAVNNYYAVVPLLCNIKWSFDLFLYGHFHPDNYYNVDYISSSTVSDEKYLTVLLTYCI